MEIISTYYQVNGLIEIVRPLTVAKSEQLFVCGTGLTRFTNEYQSKLTFNLKNRTLSIFVNMYRFSNL
jgi:hypothetical protein